MMNKKKVVKGLLPLTILSFIEKEPIHGYGIIATLRHNLGIYFGPSEIYPILEELEEEGFATSSWIFNGEKPKKIYRITDKGSTMLRSMRGSLTFILTKIGMKEEVEVKEVITYGVASE